MAADSVRMPGLIAVGHQVMTLSNSTAQSLNGTMRAARYIEFSVETNSVRYLNGATAPALTTGVLLATGWYSWEGYNGTSLLQFQRSTGTAKVTIQGYRYAGDSTS